MSDYQHSSSTKWCVQFWMYCGEWDFYHRFDAASLFSVFSFFSHIIIMHYYTSPLPPLGRQVQRRSSNKLTQTENWWNETWSKWGGEKKLALLSWTSSSSSSSSSGKSNIRCNCNFGRLFMFRIMRVDVLLYSVEEREKKCHFQFHREISHLRFDLYLISKFQFSTGLRWSKFGWSDIYARRHKTTIMIFQQI